MPRATEKFTRAAIHRNMSGKAEEIVEMLSPTVNALGLQLLGAEFSASGNNALLRLYIDVEGRYVSVEDCEAVSREVSAQLDVEDPISGNYTLEVSSPGIDRPLFAPAHYARYVGQSAKVGLKLPQDGRRRLQGRIDKVEGGSIVFDVDGKPFEVAFDNIDKAKLVPDWEALGLAPKKPNHKPAKKK